MRWLKRPHGCSRTSCASAVPSISPHVARSSDGSGVPLLLYSPLPVLYWLAAILQKLTTWVEAKRVVCCWRESDAMEGTDTPLSRELPLQSDWLPGYFLLSQWRGDLVDAEPKIHQLNALAKQTPKIEKDVARRPWKPWRCHTLNTYKCQHYDAKNACSSR